jgi:hypothetical protein
MNTLSPGVDCQEHGSAKPLSNTCCTSVPFCVKRGLAASRGPVSPTPACVVRCRPVGRCLRHRNCRAACVVRCRRHRNWGLPALSVTACPTYAYRSRSARPTGGTASRGIGADGIEHESQIHRLRHDQGHAASWRSSISHRTTRHPAAWTSRIADRTASSKEWASR